MFYETLAQSLSTILANIVVAVERFERFNTIYLSILERALSHFPLGPNFLGALGAIQCVQKMY